MPMLFCQLQSHGRWWSFQLLRCWLLHGYWNGIVQLFVSIVVAVEWYSNASNARLLYGTLARCHGVCWWCDDDGHARPRAVPFHKWNVRHDPQSCNHRHDEFRANLKANDDTKPESAKWGKSRLQLKPHLPAGPFWKASLLVDWMVLLPWRPWVFV